MPKDGFAIGSKVMVISLDGFSEEFKPKRPLGMVLTVKSNTGKSCTFEEVPGTLAWKRLKYFHPGNPKNPVDKWYDGWVNRETAEVALCFYNNTEALKDVEEYLTEHAVIEVPKAARILRNWPINGEPKNVCYRAILEDWLMTQDERGRPHISRERFQQIVDEIAGHFDHVPRSDEDEAQRIADKWFWAEAENRKEETMELSKECREHPISKHDDHIDTDNFVDYLAYVEADLATANQLMDQVEADLNGKEQDMSENKKYEMLTKHLVDGVDVSDMSIGDKVHMIRNLEAKIEKLGEVKSESKIVAKEQKRLKKLLKELVEFFDKHS